MDEKMRNPKRLQTMKKSIGGKIKRYRMDRASTQDQLSEAVEISQNHLGNIEIGKRMPSVPLLIDLANALGVTPNDILIDTVEVNNNIPMQELGKLMSKLSPQDQKFVITTMKNMIRNLKESIKY